MCYLCSESCRHRRGFRDNWLVVVFNLNGMSCTSACLFVGTIVNKVALLSTFKASASLSVFLLFFIICGLADNGRHIHSIIILRGKTWLRWCTISWSTPILVVGSRVIASRVMPNPSRVLSLTLSLSTTGIESPVFRMERLCFQVNLLLTLNCSPPLFVGFGIFHFNTCVSKWLWKSKGEGSKIGVVVHVYVSM